MMNRYRRPAVEFVVQCYLSELQDYAATDTGEYDDDITWSCAYTIEIIDRVNAGIPITLDEARNSIRNMAYQSVLFEDSKYDFDTLCLATCKLSNHLGTPLRELL